MPAYSAALASWIWRTSFCVTRISGDPARSRNDHVRSLLTTRSETAARAPSMTPSAPITPARYISATASMMPEPQIPVTPTSRIDSSNPSSSDHRSEPITRRRTASDSLSMRTRSMAPGAARCPQLTCAPSKAGPVGLEQASRRSRLPRTISAFVPTSTSSDTSSRRWGSSARTTAAVSAPTWPATHGRT